MSDYSSNNKRIAKNTIYLYLRMLVTIVIQFYTARVVLNTLGVEDFGIYNVVGGVIVLFAFLNNAMSSSSQRFLSYEIGRKDEGMVQETFNTCVYCHTIIALILVILSETIGLWFVKEKLVIPVGRETAAMVVYQLSVINTVVNVLRVPHNASIISYERMSFYAYISIFEVVMKLAIVFLLVISPFDKLISYTSLLLFVSVLTSLMYWIFCRRYFNKCRVRKGFNYTEGKKMLKYSGWVMLSGATTVANQQGGNIMLNMFFGVVYNAAYGVANQVSNAIYMFVSNFQMAFQPQIVKQYASKEHTSLIKLLFRSSSLSYYLLLVISVPFIIEADWVMRLWLGEPPEYAGSFCILLIAYFLVDAMQAPLWMVIGASGNIRGHTIWTSCIALLNLPIAYIILTCGGGILWVFAIRIILNIIISCIRVPYTKRFINISIKAYLRQVTIPALLTTTIAFIGALFIKRAVVNPFVTIPSSLLLTATIILFIGLNSADRQLLFKLIKDKISY